MLWMYQRVFFGPLTNPDNRGLQDLNRREILYLAPLVILCFWIGLYPKPFLAVLEKPVNYVVAKVDPHYATAVAAAPIVPKSPIVATAAPVAAAAGESPVPRRQAYLLLAPEILLARAGLAI